MNTKMEVYIKIIPEINTQNLTKELMCLDATVVPLGENVYVTTEIDLKEDKIEKILSICKQYGHCILDTHLSENGPL